MNRIPLMRRTAAAAAVVALTAAGTLLRPETILLETGHSSSTVASSRPLELTTGGDPIRLEPESGTLTLPSLRPGTHLLRREGVPQLDWRRISVGGDGPERHGPGGRELLAAAAGAGAGLLLLRRGRSSELAAWPLMAVAAGVGNPAGVVSAAMLLVPGGAVGGLAAWAATTISPWLPAASGAGLTIAGAAAAAVAAAARPLPTRSSLRGAAAAAGLLAAAGGTLLALSPMSREAAPLQDCLSPDEAALIRCVEEQVTLLGHQRQLAEGRAQLRGLPEAAAAAGAPLRGSWCRIGEEALTEAHVLAGGDFEEFLPEGSLCDFSLEHGIGSAAGWVLEDPTAVAAVLCQPQDLVPRPEATQITQCWHGVGQGAARRHGWDLQEAYRVCRDGTALGGTPNCLEGALSAALGRELLGGEPLLQLTADQCRSLDDDYEGACVRFLKEREAQRSGPLIAAEQMQQTCGREPELEGCWEAVGSYAGRVPFQLSQMSELSRYCLDGNGETRWECIISLYSLSFGGAEDNGISVDRLLGTLPEGMPEEGLQRLMDNFLFHTGKSGMSGT